MAFWGVTWSRPSRLGGCQPDKVPPANLCKGCVFGDELVILSLQTTTTVLPIMVIILVKLKKELPFYSLVIFFQEKIGSLFSIYNLVIYYVVPRLTLSHATQGLYKNPSAAAATRRCSLEGCLPTWQRPTWGHTSCVLAKSWKLSLCMIRRRRSQGVNKCFNYSLDLDSHSFYVGCKVLVKY